MSFVNSPLAAGPGPSLLDSSFRSPMWVELFLEEASKHRRTVPGCAPSWRSRYHPYESSSSAPPAGHIPQVPDVPGGIRRTSSQRDRTRKYRDSERAKEDARHFGTLHLNPDYISWLKEHPYVLHSLQSSVAKPVPAPRLVGIETNPGPPKGMKGVARDAGVASAAAVGAFLVDILGKKSPIAKGKKPPPKKASRRSSTSVSTRSNSRPVGIDYGRAFEVINAPIQRGVKSSTGGYRHSPVIIHGKSRLGSLGYTAAGFQYFTNPAGSVTASPFNGFNFNPVGAGTTVTDYLMFPTTIRNVVSSFLRHRWLQARIMWCPFVSTQVGGNITMAAFPEILNTSTFVPYSTITACENNATTPTWSPASFDLLQKGALQKGWFYTNATGSTLAGERQEAAGFFGLTSNGFAPVGSDTLYGDIFLEFALELEGLGSETAFAALNRVDATANGKQIPPDHSRDDHVSPEPEYGVDGQYEVLGRRYQYAPGSSSVPARLPTAARQLTTREPPPAQL